MTDNWSVAWLHAGTGGVPLRVFGLAPHRPVSLSCQIGDRFPGARPRRWGPTVNRTVRQLAALVGGEVLGDGEIVIRSARTLFEAGPGDLTFVDGIRNLEAWYHCAASAAIVPPSIPLNGRPLIRVADPLIAFGTIVQALRADRASPVTQRIDPTAHLHPTAVIGEDATIGPFVVVGEGSAIGARSQLCAGTVVGRFCTLGDDVVLHPNVVLYDDCRIGSRVTIHANAVIGADGYGYRATNGRHVKVPQIGCVEIGDDVEIGACTTIDRGTFGATRIGSGTKVDNQVMIGHNCQIGKHNLLVGQVGIAGSTKTGDNVTIAGQCGVSDHITIGDRVVVGALSGVIKDVPADSRVLGTPARPIKEAVRIVKSIDRLPGLISDVRQLKQKLGMLDKADGVAE